MKGASGISAASAASVSPSSTTGALNEAPP